MLVRQGVKIPSASEGLKVEYTAIRLAMVG